jgi:hypothetical protein
LQLNFTSVRYTPQDGINIILGQAHFIKTVEDLYEALVTASPSIRFGIGFCESSGNALVRHDGNDPALEEAAAQLAFSLSAGHAFVVLLRDAFPINVLQRVKAVQEVATVFCATANPVEVLLAETPQGRGIIGVVDGVKTRGIEGQADQEERRAFLRTIGYKR